MKEALAGKNILITGGAGSVGNALTEEILKHGPKTIRIFDLSENEMFKIKNQYGKERNVRFLIGDIRDINRLKMAMEGIDIVIHLAAMKHVYACEYNPFEAIKTNINGLQNVIDAAREENVEKVIYTSTDKAASPTSVMGMTKLLGEKIISLANFYKGDKRTVFASVRFGNVLGSNGSVVPLFKKQIAAGGPITVTDDKMTRYVITMQEAVGLIFKAVVLAKGGETFVWKMSTLTVTDLAAAMIDRYGEGKKIKIDIIGRSEGEKFHEDIMSQEELTRAVEMDDLYIVFPLIDSFYVSKQYESATAIKEPNIVSSDGKHLSVEEIKKLLMKLEAVA